MAVFGNREAAGQALGKRLAELGLSNTVVVAVSRGGVPVAAAVAVQLHAPLDLLPARTICAPHQPDRVAAAVIDGDTPEIAIDDAVLRHCGLSRETIDRQAEIELAALARLGRTLLADRPPLLLDRRAAIVVDDGEAAGITLRAALRAVRRRGAARVVLALPVASSAAVESLRDEADEVVCLEPPEPIYAIGLNYEATHRIGDSEVVRLMKAAEQRDG